MVTSGGLSLFRGKRVLVTGNTGFKGSWLTLWLHQLGARVAGYALPPERDSDLFHALALESSIDQTYADVRDAETLNGVFERVQPELVFHLAAQALVRRSYGDPKSTFDVNVGGSVNVLEAVRATPSVRSAIYVTSDKCYRNKEWVWGYRENDELGGSDPYSASKAAAELVFAAYVDSFFRSRQALGIASVRAGNVIGGGDFSTDRIVPDCVQAVRRGCPVVLRNPAATRPWQHVLEPLSGYLLLATRLYEEGSRHSGSWNFGPASGSIRTVRELAERLVELWGGGRVEVRQDRDAPHEAGLLHLNCDKARHGLGWRPRWDVDRALEEIVRWHKAVDGGEPAVEVTLAQIQEYARSPLSD